MEISTIKTQTGDVATRHRPFVFLWKGVYTLFKCYTKFLDVLIGRKQMLYLPPRKVRSDVAKGLVRIGACQVDAVKGFQYTSGGCGPLYCNLRDIQGDVVLRDRVLRRMKKIMKQRYPKCGVVAGIKTGAIPLSASLADRLHLPHVSINKELKAATGELLEGASVEDQLCAVFEDTVNKGGSAARGVKAVKDAGGTVIGCLAVLVYRESVAESLGADIFALTTVQDILVALVEACKISDSERTLVEAWLSDPSVWSPTEA